jgi:hypothetical protein
VVEGFVLPYWAGSPDHSVDAAGGGSLYGSQNFWESEDPAFSVSNGRKQQVHVIGHDDNRVHLNCFAVVVETVVKGQGSCKGRELKCNLRSECHKERAAIPLIVR